MSQLSFGDAECTGKRKQTQREVFLAKMEQMVPWLSLLGLTESFYPDGRHLKGLSKNPEQIVTLFALSTLWMARKWLVAMAGGLRPQQATVG